MAIVTGDRYLDYLVKFVDKQAGPLLEGSLVLKLNPVGLHYVQSRLEALQELEGLLADAPVDYLRAYISDLGDHRALEQLRRILRLLTSLKVVSVLPSSVRDPTPLSLLPFGRLKVLELRGCDLSTSAAKGLLELRHTLEKIICHNSTDALRHVFASRIADIKHSPVWNKLSFVSCAWNELVLMDESLQLLPAVETLDLSRNRFAKVDNLRNCTILRHLDLGFNQLRTISSFSEVSCSIVKIVLRNNALTSLRGIENLKSVEGLDLSYNIISNFSECEILASLTSLQELWLEGNPICCARWYRAQVFSLFTHLEQLKLDDKGISSRETWQSQIILASRQRRPAGFGFYSPAKAEAERAEREDSVNSKKKKLSRLAFIEDEEFRRNLLSEAVEQDSGSCGSEVRSREENILSDSEAEIVELMNKVEFMKKEQSVLWLREFKEWMDHPSEDVAESHKFTGLNSPRKESNMDKKKYYNNLGESSRYVSDLAQASEDENGTNILESDNSQADTYIGVSASPYFSSNSIGVLDSIMERNGKAREESNHLPLSRNSIHLETSTVEGSERICPTVNNMQLTAIDEIMESHSSIHPGSPPYYQEDILHRRQNLEEEFMQLSAESYSLASSDSDTSCSDGDLSILNSLPELGHLQLNEESLNRIMDGHPKLLIDGSGFEGRHEVFHLRNDKSYLDEASNTEHIEPDHARQLCFDDMLVNDSCGGEDQDMIDETGCLDKRKARRRSKRRVVTLAEGNGIADSEGQLSQKQNGILDASQTNMDDDDPGRQVVVYSQIPHEVINTNQAKHALTTPFDDISNSCMMKSTSHLLTVESIKNYFHANAADSEVSETCLQYMLCDCIFEEESEYRESEVALLLSSENKLYVLMIDVTSEGPGTISKVIGSHRLEDIKEVMTGIGLQILRVHIGVDITYMFMTRDIDKSRELLCLLQVFNPSSISNQCSLKSLEQVQVESFEKYISGGLKVSIFLYSMLLFWHNNNEEESWLGRSLFVIEGYMLVCIDDLIQFSSATVDDVSSSPYFSLDSCCSISNISEMVIEPKESRCVTLTLDCVAPEKFDSSSEIEQEKPVKEFKDKMVTGTHTWKFKWFSEETLLKFVALLKALHAGITISPPPVKCIS